MYQRHAPLIKARWLNLITQYQTRYCCVIKFHFNLHLYVVSMIITTLIIWNATKLCLHKFSFHTHVQYYTHIHKHNFYKNCSKIVTKCWRNGAQITLLNFIHFVPPMKRDIESGTPELPSSSSFTHFHLTLYFEHHPHLSRTSFLPLLVRSEQNSSLAD